MKSIIYAYLFNSAPKLLPVDHHSNACGLEQEMFYFRDGVRGGGGQTGGLNWLRWAMKPVIGDLKLACTQGPATEKGERWDSVQGGVNFNLATRALVSCASTRGTDDLNNPGPWPKYKIESGLEYKIRGETAIKILYAAVQMSSVEEDIKVASLNPSAKRVRKPKKNQPRIPTKPPVIPAAG